MPISIWLTPVLVRRLRDELRDQPLREGEIRRVVGLGRWYLAAADTDLSAHGFDRLLTLTVDGVANVVCVPAFEKCTPPDSGTELPKDP